LLSLSEENYLKAIYHLSNHGQDEVATNAIADSLKTKPASVSDMLKKLALKNLIEYEKYQGVKLNKIGKLRALQVIRKHRLWEVFLVKKLDFHWDEVHEVAEQLEHIHSELLTKKLDAFLGFPSHDPHGDPIPDENGVMKIYKQNILQNLSKSSQGVVVGVKDSSANFLQYLDKIGIGLGTTLKIVDIIAFDESIDIEVNAKQIVHISKETAKNILISV
jgi:DtxR family Mn-dependent transcriptional regulator